MPRWGRVYDCREGFHESNMGFFDELNSSPIKTMPDGQRMFFPYGNWGRGYIIPTQQDHDRLQRLIGIYTVMALALGLGAAAVSEFWLLVVAAGLMGFYLLWVRIVLDGMIRTEETITFSEVMAPHARMHAAVTQSTMLVICSFLVVIGCALLAYDRRLAIVALPCILLFGAGAAVCVWMMRRSRKSA
jgi:hypothetical protein